MAVDLTGVVEYRHPPTAQWSDLCQFDFVRNPELFALLGFDPYHIGTDSVLTLRGFPEHLSPTGNDLAISWGGDFASWLELKDAKLVLSLGGEDTRGDVEFAAVVCCLELLEKRSLEGRFVFVFTC